MRVTAGMVWVFMVCFIAAYESVDGEGKGP